MDRRRERVGAEMAMEKDFSKNLEAKEICLDEKRKISIYLVWTGDERVRIKMATKEKTRKVLTI